MKRTKYICLLSGIACLSYWRMLEFTFWNDDWIYLWRALYDAQGLLVSYFVHFGTSLEFLILTTIAGINPILWQFTGLFLHIVLAYTVGKLTEQFTSQKNAGIFAGVLFAGTSIGIQSVSWISAHIVTIDGILICYAVIRFIRSLKENNPVHLVIAFECIALGLLLDFIRTAPVFILLFIILKLYKNKKGYKFVQSIFNKFLLLAGFLSPLFLYLIYPFMAGSPLGNSVGKILHDPQRIVKYMSYLQNGVGWTWNILIGWVHPLFAASYGAMLVIPFTLLCIWMVYIYLMKKGKHDSQHVISIIMTSWFFLFLTVHWIFEPRIMYDSFHRYGLLSGIGYISLLGYTLSEISSTYIRYGLLCLLLVINCVSANRALAVESVYRNNQKIKAVWKTIDAEVAHDSEPKIFYYFGDDPAKKNILDLSASFPFGILRNIQTKDTLPYAINSTEEILPVICGDTAFKRVVSLDHVYGWFIYNTGEIINTSIALRKELVKKSHQVSCNLTIL